MKRVVSWVHAIAQGAKPTLRPHAFDLCRWHQQKPSNAPIICVPDLRDCNKKRDQKRDSPKTSGRRCSEMASRAPAEQPVVRLLLVGDREFSILLVTMRGVRLRVK
jgi:hypothetical protein